MTFGRKLSDEKCLALFGEIIASRPNDELAVLDGYQNMVVQIGEIKLDSTVFDNFRLFSLVVSFFVF